MYLKEAPGRYDDPLEAKSVPLSNFENETATALNIPEQTILIQVADSDWTERVLERAIPLALCSNAEIVFLVLVPVQHVGWLGTDLGFIDTAGNCANNYIEYAENARKYGISVRILPFQYATLVGAIVEASESVHANTVFATLPAGPISFIDKRRMRWLEHRLSEQGCRFISSC